MVAALSLRSFCNFLETRGVAGTSNVVSTSARQATESARVQLHLGSTLTTSRYCGPDRWTPGD